MSDSSQPPKKMYLWEIKVQGYPLGYVSDDEVQNDFGDRHIYKLQIVRDIDNLFKIFCKYYSKKFLCGSYKTFNESKHKFTYFMKKAMRGKLLTKDCPECKAENKCSHNFCEKCQAFLTTSVVNWPPVKRSRPSLSSHLNQLIFEFDEDDDIFYDRKDRDSPPLILSPQSPPDYLLYEEGNKENQDTFELFTIYE